MQDNLIPFPKPLQRISLIAFVRQDAQVEESLGALRTRCPRCQHQPEPTVTIFDGSETFHCTTCDLSGDIFTWVGVTRGLSFRQAFNWILMHSKARHSMGEN